MANKNGKIKISFINVDGFEVIRYVTPLELSIISKVINITIL
jgi:hypothetical protein